MKYQGPAFPDDFENPSTGLGEAEARTEGDLWFMPGPIEDEQGRYRMWRAAN